MAMKKQASGKKDGSKTNIEARATTCGDCISLGTAGMIVQAAIPGGPYPIDKTLVGVGLKTDGQRQVFRDHVFDGVLEAGCHIDKGAIPNAADKTIRAVRDAIKGAAN